MGCHSRRRRRHFPPPPLFPLSCLIISLSSSACHFKWLFPPYSLSLCCGATEHSYSPPPRSTKKRAHKKGAEWAKKHFPYYPPMGFQLSLLVCTSVYSKLDKIAGRLLCSNFSCCK